MATAAYYPVNDTSLSAAERGYLQQLQDAAATQNLDEDLRPEVRDLSIAFTVLACFVVGLRFLARHLQRAPIGIDDWMILVSLTFLGGNLAFNIVMIGQGLGLHSGRVTLEQLQALNEVRATDRGVFWCSRTSLLKHPLIRPSSAPRLSIRPP